MLLVTAGGVASYVYRYQVWQGDKRKFRTMNLGRRDGITLHEARKKCEEARSQVENGVDVVLEKALKSEALTLKQLFNERKEKEGRRAASTLEGYESVLEADVFPVLGDLPAAEITAEQIVAVLAAIEERSKSMAHRARSALGSTYRFGLKRRIVKINPTAGLGFIHVSKPRKRVLTADELAALWDGLETREGMSEPTALILKLCLLTGQRESECAGARLSEFTLGTTNPRWHIPAERMKRKERDQYVPLTPGAVAVVKRAKELSAGDECLFPADLGKLKKGKTRTRTPHINRESVSRAMARLCEDLKIKNARVHDFRKVLTTWVREHGHSKDVCDLILHHASGSVTGSHYDFAVLDGPVRAALNDWARHVTTGKKPAKVLRLPERVRG